MKRTPENKPEGMSLDTWLWRCAVCGQFMCQDAPIYDISQPSYGDLDYPEPSWAHQKCVTW